MWGGLGLGIPAVSVRKAGGGAPLGANTPISADTRGNIITLTSTPATEYLDQVETIVHSGYNSAAVLHNWTEPAIIRRRKRTPGTLATFDAASAMFSRTLLLGETILGRPSFVNNSTRTPPVIEGRWLVPHLVVRDATDRVQAGFQCAFSRNGTQVACVRYYWKDTNNLEVTSPLITAPTKRTHPLTGLVSHVYDSGDVDISTLADGIVRRRFVAYGHHGQVLDSDNFTNVHDGATGFIRRCAGYEQVYVCVREGAVTAGAPSTTIAGASGNAYPNTATGVRNAMIALGTENNARNGYTGVDGGIILLDGGAEGVGTAPMTLAGPSTSASIIWLIAGVTFMANPLSYAGNIDLTIAGPSLRNAGTLLPSPIYGVLFNKCNVIRPSGSGGLFTTTGIQLHVWVRNGGYNANNPTTSPTPIFSNGHFYLEDSTLTGLDTATYALHMLGTSGTNTNSSTLIGVLGGDCNQTNLPLQCIVGSKFENCRLANNTGTGNASGSYIDASTFMRCGDPANSSPIIGVNVATGRAAYAQNYVFENRQDVSNNAFSFSADNGLINMRLFWRNGVMAGLLDANRTNSFYVDVNGADPRVHDFCGFEGVVMPMQACKGDKFRPAFPQHYTGWVEAGSGVNSSGNFHVGVWGDNTDNDAPDAYGTGCTVAPGRGAPLDPGYVAPALPATLGGGPSLGSTDPLNYRLKSQSRGIGASGESAAIGSVSYIPGVRWDILGNDLAAGVTCTTPGPFAGLYD